MSPPAAVWFGPPERPLLGFYHAGEVSCLRSRAVVLCYPFGHEYTAAYQAYRRLAEMLAEAGFPVFRFDYDGTGDSAGDDSDPARLSAWLGSIGLAIEQVQAQSGARDICLFGLRLGAMLAYLAAAEHASVRELVLWAPSLTGKVYLREWRALRMLKDGPGAPTLPGGDEEAGGFLMTRQTIAELLGVELLARPVPLVARVLLLARDVSLGEQRLADHLRAHGVAVDHRFLPGYEGLVVEPYNVVIPEAAFAEIVSRLADANAAADDPAPERLASSAEATMTSTSSIRESALRFGPDDALFGVLSEPLQAATSPARPALLLLNTSVIHRVGPNRMYVPMARRWAAAGYTVLRFDVAGLGDSPLAGWQARQRMYQKDSVRDVRAAMDWLSSHRGIQRFVLIGLCSGAYLAFHSGLADPRVAGQVMLNPQTFAWKEGDSLDVGRKLEYKSSRYYLRALLKRETWSRLLHGQIHWQGIAGALAERALKNARTLLTERLSALLPREDAPTEPSVLLNFRRLLDGGVAIFLVYSQEDPGLDELAAHLGQDARLLRSHRRFRLELIDGPDHTFTPVGSQRRLQETLRGYLDSFARQQ